MASTIFTLPPTSRPRLTFKRWLNLPNPPPKTFPLFPGGFSVEFREPTVLVPVVRASLGVGGSAVKNNALRKCGGRSPYEYWRQRSMNDGEGLVISHEELHKIMKLLASIMSFVSVDGDPYKGVEEKKRELVLQYIISNGGAIVPAEEYYRYLVGLLKEYTDIRERQSRSRELEFRDLSLLGNVLSLIGKLFSWNGLCWFCLLCAITAIGLLCIFIFPGVVIWNRWVRRPDPPPSPPPKIFIGFGIVTSLLSIFGKLSNFFPTQM